jgi:ADP-ribose pyrophosphatase
MLTSGPSRKRVLVGAKFSVDQVQVPTRSGGETERLLVVHPGAAVVLPLLDDGRVVLIRNHRFSVGRELWELPAGTIDAGEPPAETAARELEEETGYRAARVEPLLGFYSSPGICDERMHGFLATGLTRAVQRLEETERIEVESRTADELRDMIRRGDIEDGKTIALGLYWLAFRSP